jgi:hypothetical protein
MAMTSTKAQGDMPFEHEIAFCPPIAQLIAHGSPDVGEWRAAIKALVDDPNLPLGAPILCDLRAVTTLPPAGKDPAFSRQLMQLVPSRSVALVVRAETASGVIQQISTGDAEIQIFTDYKTALRWLLFGPRTDA